jgi:hypothetical protein
MVGSLPVGGHATVEGVEVPRTKGWAPWPTGLHAAKEEKRRKEEEERKKTEEEEQKKKKEEEEEGGSKVTSPPHDLSVGGAPDSSPLQQ